ncbi:MAG: peptidase S16 [Chloroflexaceae bacterium]|nr:peptidase S16 [Chloroflexaceae bacterium]NJL34097.1 peptidase S16 [Chloroflexaceae bacterium]NJO06547.1 peptidase S16 [Chloroflexaceae bacterium]
MITTELPLFPLNTVMFPGASLTLHIFEERYRAMIGRCLEEGSPFGVILIRHGQEVGEPAMPHDIGTVVQINASVRLEDGRMLIATIGQQRFKVSRIVHQLPYMVAQVSLLPEETEPGMRRAADELRALHEQYWQSVMAATGVQYEFEQLPDDVVAMSHHLAHRLQVPNERKQRWLEVDTPIRMREIMAMLRHEINLLPRSSNNRSLSSSNMPWSWN